LDFGGNKTLAELAQKLEGKSVVVTGTLSGRANLNAWPYPSTIYYNPYLPNPYPYGPYYASPTLVLTVATLKADE
jgi:hypothetical protein